MTPTELRNSRILDVYLQQGRYWLSDMKLDTEFRDPNSSIVSRHKITLTLVGSQPEEGRTPAEGGYYIVPSEGFSFEELSKKTIEELLVDNRPMIRAIAATIVKVYREEKNV